MEENEPFLGAIESAPYDDAPRLVYADWLDERDDARAQFIRNEVRLANIVRAQCLETAPKDDDRIHRARIELLELRAAFEPDWWQRLIRATCDEKLVVRCASCGLPLSQPVQQLADRIWLREQDQEPLLPPGYWWRLDGDVRAGTNGHVCINLSDLRNTRPHPDSRRWNGCCGPDGCDGPNTLCLGGHEIGTECSDCWMPRYFHFEPTATELVESAKIIECSPAPEPDVAEKRWLAPWIRGIR